MQGEDIIDKGDTTQKKTTRTTIFFTFPFCVKSVLVTIMAKIGECNAALTNRVE